MSLTEIQDLVRKGMIAAAQDELKRLKTRNLSREERLRAAHVAREAHCPAKVIEILYPIVRPGARVRPLVATPEEKGEYAIALVYLGLNSEARTLVRNVPLSSQPRAAEALAFSYFRDGDFKTALQITSDALRSKSKMRDGERYELLLDHGLSLLHGQSERYRRPDLRECRKVFSELLAEIGGSGFALVRRFAFIGVAISHLYERDWDGCDRGLDEAEALARGFGLPSRSASLLLWRRLAGLGRAIDRGRETASHRRGLVALKEGFIRSGLAGYARACDYDTAVLLGDAAALERMYFDVSQECYRSHIETQLRMLGARVPDFHDRALGKPGARPVRPIDLFGGEKPTPFGLKTGQLPHRILTALAGDIYTRPNLVHLFGLVFPDEHFNPESSIAKVEQGLVRLRQTLKRCRAPLVVAQEKGLFRLDAPPSVKLRFYRSGELAAFQTRLRAAFGKREFSSTEFAAAFDMPVRTAKSRLRQACETGWLARSKSGRATGYRLP